VADVQRPVQDIQLQPEVDLKPVLDAAISVAISSRASAEHEQQAIGLELSCIHLADSAPTDDQSDQASSSSTRHEVHIAKDE